MYPSLSHVHVHITVGKHVPPDGTGRKMQRTGSSQNQPRSVPNRSEGQRCKYAEQSYGYKYDLGHSIVVKCCCIFFCKCSCTERESERERERGCCLLYVTAAACGEEEDERSLPLRFLDSVFLSYSGIFCSLCAAVVFPTFWVFHVTSCVSTLLLVSVFISCIHSLYSVVADRTSGVNPNTPLLRMRNN